MASNRSAHDDILVGGVTSSPRNTRSCQWTAWAVALLGAVVCANADAESIDPTSLPLTSIDDFSYVGAFRVPATTGSSVSSMNFALGPIAYNPDRHSVFMSSHDHHQALIEFAVPEIVQSTKISDLNMATVLQNFSRVLDRAPNISGQRPNRIAGMQYLRGPNGPELLMNVNVFYTGETVTDQALVVRNPNDLAGSVIDGYFELEGRERASGWISPVPSEWHDSLGGRYLTGHASNIAISSRLSIGPSAYVFDPFHIVGRSSVPRPVPTDVRQVFPYEERLHKDNFNVSGENDLWTELSRVHYGFIIPGTRTFFTVGRSGGHNPPAGWAGICYKDDCPPGVEYGGPGASDPDDYYHFYWLWDVNDLIAVRNGTATPFQARPYSRGVFPTPKEFQGPSYYRKIGGGSFDPVSGLLFLTSQMADQQGEYDIAPIVLVYKVNSDQLLVKRPMAPTDVRVER